jgi:hypothetical protein
MDRDRLYRARQELGWATEHADANVRTQLESVEDGIFEEECGDVTQTDPGPKNDRIVAVMEKLDGLEAAADHRDVAERIGTAHDLLEAYLKSHPDDG